MADNEWLLSEMERAAERTRDLPAHAKPIVTRPLVAGRRVPQPSEKPTTDDAVPRRPSSLLRGWTCPVCGAGVAPWARDHCAPVQPEEQP